MHAKPSCEPPDPMQLAVLLRDADIDAAIAAGLMDFVGADRRMLDDATRSLLLDAQQRLRAAWEARERYRTRQARLLRRGEAREARRAPPLPAAASGPGLPNLAAAALARAKARAGT